MVDPAGPTGEIESELVDLTDLTLDQVQSLDESALGTAIRQVLTETTEEPIAGFNAQI